VGAGWIIFIFGRGGAASEATLWCLNIIYYILSERILGLEGRGVEACVSGIGEAGGYHITQYDINGLISAAIVPVEVLWGFAWRSERGGVVEV